jgi:hypothetical protein
MNTVAPVINTSIEYIKGFNPLNSSLFKTISGFSLFRSKVKDVSGIDGSGIDPSSEAFNNSPTQSSPTGIINAIIAVAKNPNGTTILNLIMVLFYYILIIMLASFIANSLIFAHWGLRLFSFLFVLYLTKNSPILVYPLATYYIIRALRNGYINFRDKLSPENKLSLFPTHYAILPIITARGSRFDMFPIFYFSKGHDPKDAKYHFFKRDESKHKAELDSVVPGIQQIKSGNKKLVKNFADFLEEINRSYIKLLGVASKAPISNEEANAKAERDAIEQHITGTIAKTTGAKAVEYIKTLGKVVTTPVGVVAPPGVTAAPAPAPAPAAKGASV